MALSELCPEVRSFIQQNVKNFNANLFFFFFFCISIPAANIQLLTVPLATKY